MIEQTYFNQADLNDGKVLCLYGGEKDDPFRGQWLESPKPHLSVLNFSGGKQSSAILWMVLRGEIPPPDVVMSANPGMEAAASLAYIKRMQAECAKVGLPCYTVSGPNLYQEILDLKSSKRTRFDTPAYYVLNDDGTEGKLNQRCTSHFKIAPMNRACRVELEKRLGISRRSSKLPRAIVEKWIGFSASEVSRIKPPTERWSCFHYPLIDLGMTNDRVVGYFLKHDLPMPPRSVCNGCFANDLDYFRDMHANRPEDWKQALAVDDAIRDWKSIGVKQPVFITRCCKSLRALEASNFQVDGDTRNESCDSGYCFT